MRDFFNSPFFDGGKYYKTGKYTPDDPAAQWMLDHIDVLKESVDIFAKGVVDAGDTMVDETETENGETSNSDRTKILENGQDDGYNDYTEEQYNNFGWVRANNILSKSQFDVFASKFADIVSGNQYAHQTKSGEYIIPTHEEYGENAGVSNVLVFASGSMDSPVISSVLYIDLNNETDLDKERRIVYDSEWRGVQQKTVGVVRRYDSSSYKYTDQRRSNKSNSYSRGDGLLGRRSGKTAQRVKEYRFNEDGSQTITYRDGSQETYNSDRITMDAPVEQAEDQFGVTVDSETESASPTDFSLRTWIASDY